MQKHPVIRSSNGKQISVDLIRSPAARQIAAQPHLLAHAQAILCQQTLTGERLSIETDMGRIIGTSEVVEVGEKDTVFYAQRIGSDSYGKFVKNRGYRSSRYISIMLEQTSADNYQLTDIYVGRLRPAFPDDSDMASDESTTFWQSHAIVWESKLGSARTITRDCPWPSPVVAS